VATAAVLRHGRASGLELARLVGGWTWAALARRPALSVFCGVYRFIQAAGSRQFVLWSSVRRELEIITDLAPLLFTNTRATTFGQLVAADASSTGIGVCATRTDTSGLAVMAKASSPRHSRSRAWDPGLPMRGGESEPGLVNVDHLCPSLPAVSSTCVIQDHCADGDVRDDANTQDEDGPPHSLEEDAGSPLRPGCRLSGRPTVLESVPSCPRVSALSVSFVQQRQWRTIFSHRDSFTNDHINIRELRALSLAVRWSLSHPDAVASRLVLLSDSLVVLSAVTK
jgi:hypothetical protein